MSTVLLLRHGRSTSNTAGTLAGWSPGVDLDDLGRTQADGIAERLAELTLSAIVCSPLPRCRQTVAPLAKRLGIKVTIDRRLGECKYGDWTGKPIKDLVKEPLWRAIQAHPSSVTFPGPEGESMLAMQARMVAAVRDWNARIAAEHGEGAVWLACSHGDPIKSLVADAMGLHLDLFQRVVVDPGSITAIRYTELRPFVLKVNDTGGDVGAYRAAPPPKKGRRKAGGSDAVVGGGAGPAAASADANGARPRRRSAPKT
ncbi:MAG: histidine phosphatase family protein [Sporichthyaceae bacterium]